MYKAKILWAWAADIDPQRVFVHNTPSSEDIATEMNLRRLGGLTVELDSYDIYDAIAKERARLSQHIIDLSLGTDAVQTHTSFLLTAAEDQLGEASPLITQLRRRFRQTDEHRADEPWFLPVSGVELLEVTAADTAAEVTTP